MGKTLKTMWQKAEMHLNREEKMLMPKKGITNSWLRSMRSHLLFLRSAMSKMTIIDLFSKLREVLKLQNRKSLQRMKWRDLIK